MSETEVLAETQAVIESLVGRWFRPLQVVVRFGEPRMFCYSGDPGVAEIFVQPAWLDNVYKQGFALVDNHFVLDAAPMAKWEGGEGAWCNVLVMHRMDCKSSMTFRTRVVEFGGAFTISWNVDAGVAGLRARFEEGLR